MADSQEYRSRFFFSNFVFLGILLGILVVVFALRDLLSGGKMDLTADKVYTISPATKDILGELIDDIIVTYYASSDLPGQLQTLERDTRDLFEEFYELSGSHFQYTILDPEATATEHAEGMVAAYYEAKEAGRTPEEPEPPQTIQDIFSGRQQAKPEDIKVEREKTAATLAAREKGRTQQEVFRDLLLEDFRRQYFKQLEADGIGAFQATEREASSVRQVKVYSSIKMTYLAEQPEIIPVHYQIESLEYELASRILKLTTENKPVVAFFDSRKAPAPPMNPMQPQQAPPGDYVGITQFLSEQFDMRDITLKEGDSIDDLVRTLKEAAWRRAHEDEDSSEMPEAEKEIKPEEVKKYIQTFIVAQPDGLEKRQLYEISRAVSLGVPTIFLVSRYSMDISRTGVSSGIPLAILTPGVEELFRKWGIEFGSEVLASNRSGAIEMPRRFQNFQIMAAQPLSINVAASDDSIDQSTALTNRIQQLIFPASAGLELLPEVLKKAEIEAEVLVRTPPESWSVKVDPFARMQNPLTRNQGMGVNLVQYQDDLVAMKDPDEFRDFIDPVPLAVLLDGKLPFLFQGETVPEWSKEEDKPADPHAGFPGMPGMPGLPPGFGGDGDLRLNAADPEEGNELDSPLAAGEEDPEEGAATGAQETEEKEEEAPPVKADVKLVPGRALVLGSVDMIKNEFLMQQSQEYRSNILFFQNAVETFGLGDKLIKIRVKQLTTRQFKSGSDKLVPWITFLNLVGVPLLVGVLGIFYYLVRRADSNAYERRFIQRP
jgi:ABC-type uncharacterized transport system involved in gliding motility auxiliary subunit